METELNLKPYYKDIIPLRIVVVIVCFITACSVFQTRGVLKTDSLSKTNSSVKTDSDQRSNTNSLRIYDHSDSSDHSSWTEIFPDGFFNYSEKGGYSGQAKRILIASRNKEQKQVHGSEQLAESQQSRVSSIAKGSQLTKKSIKEKMSNPNRLIPLYIAGCLLIYAAVYLFRKRLFISLK